LKALLEPELIFELAQRNQIELPYKSVDSLRAAYAFKDLQSFLDIYYAGASVLIKEQDFYDMAHAYSNELLRTGVVYVEMFFYLETDMERGIRHGHGDQGLGEGV
jgi:adenosine deaminase